MDKQALLEYVYSSAFNDELEKLGATGFEKKIPKITSKTREFILNKILQGKGVLKDTRKKLPSSREIKEIKQQFKNDAIAGLKGKRTPRFMGLGKFEDYLQLKGL